MTKWIGGEGLEARISHCSLLPDKKWYHWLKEESTQKPACRERREVDDELNFEHAEV
jgi:hypothetical protein